MGSLQRRLKTGNITPIKISSFTMLEILVKLLHVYFRTFTSGSSYKETIS